MRHATGLIVLGLIALSGPATASASEVLLYGPGVPSPEAAAEAALMLEVAAGVTAPSGGVSHVIDLPFPSAEPVWETGGLLVLPCSDTGRKAPDPVEQLRLGIGFVDELDYEKALLELERGIRALPCTAQSMGRQTLTRLHYFQGLAEFELDNEAKARRAFAQALAIDVELPWDANYPPEPQALFEQARSDLKRTGPTTVDVDVRGGGVSSLRFDGDELSVTAPVPRSVYPGRHLVAYTTTDGETATRLVDVSGKGGTFITREALREAVLNLAWGGMGADAARTILSDLARSRGVEDIYVVLLPEDDSAAKPRAYRFTVSTEEVVPLSVDADQLAAARRASAPKTPTASGSAFSDEESGRFQVTLGGGVFAIPDLAYAMVALRAMVRIVKGLEVGVGFFGALTRGEYDLGDGLESQTFFLPGGTVDLRWRFNAPVASPSLGLRGLIGVTQSEEWVPGETRDEAELGVTGGLAGTAAIEFVIPRHRGLVIGIGGAFGGQRLLIGESVAWVEVGAHVGARF